MHKKLPVSLWFILIPLQTMVNSKNNPATYIQSENSSKATEVYRKILEQIFQYILKKKPLNMLKISQ